MATTHARRPEQRPKIIQYGKNKGSTSFSNLFDDEGEDSGSAVQRRVNSKHAHTGSSLPKANSESQLPVKTVTPKKSTAQPTRKREAKPRDVYDFALSDNEDPPKAKRRSPPKLTEKPNLTNGVVPPSTQLAPWERRKQNSQTSAQAVSRRAIQAAMPVKPHGLAKSDISPMRTKLASPRQILSEPTGAAARLAAKRKAVAENLSQSSNEVQLRTQDTQNRAIADDAPRKRAKQQKPGDDAGDVVMRETPLPAHDEDADIFDFPDSTDSHKSASASPRKKTLNVKRTKPSSTIACGALQIGSSAPARLSEMVPTALDPTDETSASPPSTASRPSTPRRSMTPANLAVTPSTSRSVPRNVSLTPKQNEVWSRLLADEKSAPSPGSIPMKDLHITERRSKPANAPPRLGASKSDVGRVRRVDALKAEIRATQTTDDEESSDDDTVSDVDMEEQSHHSATNRPVVQRAGSYAQLSQSQLSNDVPKITYAAVRSYLPEDSLEDGLMLGFAPSSTSQTQAAMASQRSEFDLDDSEEEHAPAKLKSVHELRAAGRNISFMQETESLLEEIAKHALHARSRRRSALMELASKLADKTYTEMFLRQGFEEQLIKECKACQDDIADFVFAVALTRILAGEIPQHSLVALHSGGALLYLTKLLNTDVPMARLAKERKNNMSPSAQIDLVKGFLPKVQSSDTLWEHAKPKELTPKVIAMRALDLLIGKLRRAGDRTELLDKSHLPLLAGEDGPDVGDAARVSLSISVLEALSTASSMVAWPQEVVSRVSVLLPGLTRQSKVPQHTIFLAMRLTLNLTNENCKNCKTFSERGVIRYLLDSIKDGFTHLEANGRSEDDPIVYDLLVLALGIMINLAERGGVARENATHEVAAPTFATLLDIFQRGQTRAEEADSMAGASTNVAFGYLSIVLANLCQSAKPRAFIASRLPGRTLDFLVDAVREFVAHNLRVDSMEFVDEQGREAWRTFTDKLKTVLSRLQSVQDKARS